LSRRFDRRCGVRLNSNRQLVQVWPSKRLIQLSPPPKLAPFSTMRPQFVL
jgi:hypothetical protein